jgi:CheY-like chemotaxis protein
MKELSPQLSTPKRILVVDHHPAPAKVMAALFGRLGHHVYVANDAVRAIHLALEVAPDLIIMELPGSKSFQAARQIRRLLRGKRPLIVATTDWEGATGWADGEGSDVDVHLVRPVEFEVLKQLVAWTTGSTSSFEFTRRVDADVSGRRSRETHAP